MRDPHGRILVLWASEASPNLGVRALARGSHDLLARVWPTAEFVFADFGQRPREVPWGRVRSLARERVTGRLGMQEWFRSFDLVWDTRSGDSFSDLYGLGRLGVMSSIHEFARQAGTPVVMAPQTIGPFRSIAGRLLARRTLSRSSLVFARDPQSAAASRTSGRPVDATVTDLVFGIAQPTRSARRDVLLNVSGLLWHESGLVDSATYRESVRTLIRLLLAEGRRVTLLPHVMSSTNPDTDVPTAMRLAEEFDGRIDVVFPVDLDEARSIIGSASLVIGARMHACLNALSTGVPAIAMAYSRKFDPLLRSLDWPHVVSLHHGTAVSADIIRMMRTDGLAESAVAARDRGARLLDRTIPFLEGLQR